MAEYQHLFPLPKGNGAETRKPKTHAALGGLTFEQFRRLPHAEQMRITAAHQAGLRWECHEHPQTGQPYMKGIRPKP